jgi:hypothetical protein
MNDLMNVTATRLAGAAAVLRELAEKQGGDGRTCVALNFVADAVEESVREIDAACDPG